MSKVDLRKEIGNRLKEVRINLGLTQAELGEAVNETRAVLSQIEQGKTFPNPAIQNILRKDYNINLNWLISDEGEMFSGATPDTDITDLYPNLPHPETWNKLMKSMIKNPDQALLRIHELKKQEFLECKTFLELGYDTIRTKEEMLAIYEQKYGKPDSNNIESE